MLDEYPAILQAGETVIPKRSSNTGSGGKGDTIIQQDGQPTPQDVDTQRRQASDRGGYRNKSSTRNAIVQNYNNDGVVRKVMRGR